MRLNLLGICDRTKPDDTILPQYPVTYIFSPQKIYVIGARTLSSKWMKHLFLLPYINYTRGYSNSLSWSEKIPLCRGVQLINVEGLKGKNNISKSLFCNDGNFYNGGTGPSPLESTDQQQHRWSARSQHMCLLRGCDVKETANPTEYSSWASKVLSEFNQIFKCNFQLTRDRGERSLRPFTVKRL